MGLSCECSSFDKADCDSWYEVGRPSIPPSGSRCCECNALLPNGERRQTILLGEVYDPGEIETPPPEPGLLADNHEISDAAYDRAQDAWDAYCAKYGWNSDYERFETFTTEYRCERCEGLADAIEGMGYCMVPPGELADQHEEYVNEVAEGSGHCIRWKQDPDGVWNPYRELPEDRIVSAVQLGVRRARLWFRYGWKSDLRWKVIAPLTARTMRALGYTWTYVGCDPKTNNVVYGWVRKDPPWIREAEGR